jgi:hypothetical protein
MQDCAADSLHKRSRLYSIVTFLCKCSKFAMGKTTIGIPGVCLSIRGAGVRSNSNASSAHAPHAAHSCSTVTGLFQWARLPSSADTPDQTRTLISLVLAHPPQLPPLAYVEYEPLRWKMMSRPNCILTCHLTCHPKDKRLVDTGVVRGSEPCGS